MGRSKNKRYTLDYKKQAVDLAKRMGVSRAAEELGVSQANLHRWKSKDGQGSEKRSEVEESPEQKIRRLEKENDELKKVNLILRKAAAFFSQDQLK